MKLRPYQQKAVDWLCEHDRGLVVAPAGSGKTIIAAAALARCMGQEPEHNPCIGWVANTKEQCQQASAALDTFSILPHADVCCAAANLSWANKDVLIVDEAHHATAPQWRKQIESCTGVRWGFTATPWGRDRQRNEQLKAMFGNNVYVVDRDDVDTNLCPARVVWLDACDAGLPELIEAEIDAELKRRLRFRRYQLMPRAQARGEVAWGVCADLGIHQNAARNQAAFMAATQHAAPTLVLCGMVQHARAFADACDGVAVWSGMPAKERAKAINGFRSGEIRRLVATTLADEGFDAPCAEVLVLLSGGRNEARTIQRTGRVLRPHAGKTEAVIYDFKDSAIPLMHRHAMKRSEIYRRLNFSNWDFTQPSTGVLSPALA